MAHDTDRDGIIELQTADKTTGRLIGTLVPQTLAAANLHSFKA
ncbi:hypothetical protein QQY66_14690 [Streptomyces sp. DG2A-72]|nr:hypothetical protein [Streptomyces sp. DG2A-72]MDO0932881.1 hypothetical protein [Streptomyces sp. DG2A-72]